MWNCLKVNATRIHWWLVNIGSDNDLLLSGNKPLHKPMLNDSCCQMASLGRCELTIWRVQHITDKEMTSVVKQQNRMVVTTWQPISERTKRGKYDDFSYDMTDCTKCLTKQLHFCLCSATYIKMYLLKPLQWLWSSVEKIRINAFVIIIFAP